MTDRAVTAHTEASLTAAILARFGAVGSLRDGRRYVVAVQVNNGAGFSYGRTLDAVAFDTWPSKGLGLHGFEVKCSSADLRRELQHPDKSSAFTPYLDTFSIVAPAKVITPEREAIPRRWGLYAPNDAGELRTIRKPLYLHEPGEHDRETVDRSFAAAFVRALVQRSLSDDVRQEAFEQGRQDGIASLAHDIKQAERLREQVAAFAAASGICLSEYGPDGRQVGEAVRFVLSGGLKTRIGYASDLRALGQQMLTLADELDSLQDAMAMPKEAEDD
jgi:hypothetical protein